MRIAVTGGAGFIGGNLVFALISGGHEVLVVDDLSTGSEAVVHRAAEFSQMDILDDGLGEALTGFEPDAVVHLAAQTSVATSVADPERDWRINVDGTRAVARAAADAGARRVLTASTAAVYGEPAEIPLAETSPTEPANPYGRSKLESELVLAEELRPMGVDFAAMRLANVYGPGQSAEGEGGAVAIFTDRALASRPITVFGDGMQTRDFVFVGDIVQALIAALASTDELAEPGPNGPAYNISCGEETTVDLVAREIATAAGVSPDIRYEPAREGDVLRSALDPSKALKAFEWRAATSLPRGIAATIEWFGSR